MKKLRITGALIMAMALCQNLSAQTEQLVVPLSTPGKPFTLDVNLIAGSIKVALYDGKDIIVDASAKADGKKEDGRETSGGMRRISSGNGINVSAEEKANKVSIHSEGWSKPTNLSIKIPQGSTTVKLHTINDGDIVVDNISGELEVTNVNGAITLSGVSGSVVANTINGHIKTTFKTITATAPMAFTTLNGDVDITFPATLKADVKLKSDNGEIYTDFDIVIDRNQPKVNKSSSPGTYKVNIDQWVYGKINAGGPELMMKNMHGNIYIRKSK
ncbi:DUF4097 family beta strand repeat protein [Emticicia sp. CRIBPO]|uniref:DUF4097 family beta strand repeat-containing protein n=1 Tax=Emticicia sp. CRIBPO TaxID=2683258 RepID=UPI001412D9B4|nr:DUF4097 family beta strand repeat-containing protein [Emticicia sp. CRIBPO]NBA85791.1 DUF4097 family beta strand repeat protein [Emticicia sp. CRIBPO]